MTTSITTSTEARTLTLKPIDGGLYVLPIHHTKQYWLSLPLANMPSSESLSGFAVPVIDNMVFTVPEIVVVLTFDEQSGYPLVAGVPTGAFLPPKIGYEFTHQVAPIFHDVLRQLSLPVEFSRHSGSIYADLRELEPDCAASIGFHVASDDVSIPEYLRIVPVGQKEAGLAFPGKTFEELKIHGVIARGASRYDGKNLHLSHFWVTAPSKAGLIHPFLSRLVPGTEVTTVSEGAEEISDTYVRLRMDEVTRFSRIGGQVYLVGEDIYCDTLDLMPEGSDPIHGLRVVLSCYSPCSIVDADQLLSSCLSSGDASAINHGSSVVIGRHLFFNGEFRHMDWEHDPEPVPF